MISITWNHGIHPILRRLIAAACVLMAAASLNTLQAQPIPVGDLKEDQYRLLQLWSDSTIHTSFLSRPLWGDTYDHIFQDNHFEEDAWWGQNHSGRELTYTFSGFDIRLGGYEPVMTATYNSTLPYGENNGAAWYGRGLNSELQGGFYITSDYFTISLRPHLTHTQNRDFEEPSFLPTYPDGSPRYVEPGWLPEDTLAERIDRPFRFGPDSYTTLDWGHSSIRAHYKSIEAGVGTEPLWWGPGNRYALAMSNNAAGLPHGFIGTRRPLALPYNIGKLEFRWIFAYPQDSRYFDLNIDGNPSREERIDRMELLSKKRFMNGLNVVYTPSFAPNLSVGLSRIIHQYIPERGLSIGEDILGVFKAYPRPDTAAYSTPRDESNFEEVNPITSVYFRWVWPESNAEFYGELYKGDHNVNLRDFLMEPQHGRAYTLGLQKLLEFDGFLDFVRVSAEYNSLLPGRIDDVRPQTYFYTHKKVKQGHTNRGEVLGAAIGPGSASQFIGADGFFDQGKLGFFVQRVVDNNHFHYEHQARYFPGGGYKDQFHHRINLNIGLSGTYKYGPVLLDGAITWNKNFNYGRHDLGERAFYTITGNNVVNWQYQLSVRYLF